ncbi:hypothetical protein HN954_02065 [bacterium]|jgi:hypothetical protein|nr:hypothetical protein [bacterium]MBT6832258.1 hypothetical protein [bacterium]MBT6996195.1 hypothetical protein [bacterium]MBT7772442.1 hypothetical protein [bacterium]
MYINFSFQKVYSFILLVSLLSIFSINAFAIGTRLSTSELLTLEATDGLTIGYNYWDTDLKIYKKAIATDTLQILTAPTESMVTTAELDTLKSSNQIEPRRLYWNSDTKTYSIGQTIATTTTPNTSTTRRSTNDLNTINTEKTATWGINYWDIILKKFFKGQVDGSLAETFTDSSPITVTTINPNTGASPDPLTIAGTGFVSGATVKLTKTGQSDVTCSGFTVVDSTSITGGLCDIILTAVGDWNVVVTNPDTESGNLANGFTVSEYALRDTGPAGGFIFYVNPNYETDGWRYLEAAPVDQGTIKKWWSETSTLIGGTDTAIGTGFSNTNTIVDDTAPSDTSAIGLAYNYEVNGYSDWFLPSQDELGLMYMNLHLEGVGGFVENGYWSSSEVDATQAIRRTFSGNPDTPETRNKTAYYRTRAIRRIGAAETVEEESGTYHITYDGNGNTGGTVPIDSNDYETDSDVTILNAENLVKDGRTIESWNTAADGSGITYQVGETITMDESDITLYAIWDIDFNVAIFPDTQSLVNWKRSAITSNINWLIDNKNTEDIRFVGHVGDIVAEWDEDLTEWEFIQDELGQLGAAGINYSTLPGNHDYAKNDPRNNTMLNSYFPLSTFSGMSSYGGAYDGNSDNTYHILDVGDEQLLIMSLEFGPRDAVVAWANGVIQANSDKKVMILTHAYINIDGDLLSDGMNHAASNGYGLGEDVNDGDDLWTKLVYPNNNVAFVISGHDSTTTDGAATRESTHADGSPVHQILTNYQSYSSLTEGSYLLFLNFTDDSVAITTYSPYSNQYNTDSDAQMTFDWSF